MTIKIQGTYVIVRKKGSGNDSAPMIALSLREATDRANEDWMQCCDESLLRYNVLDFSNVGHYHIADTGLGYTYQIVYIPAKYEV
jgi:hypothetical protein